MKFLRFLFFLCLIFLVCFFYTGGTELLDTQSFNNVKNQLALILTPSGQQPPTETTPQKIENVSPQISTFDRISRVLFLKRAVNRAINKKDYIPLDQIATPLQEAIIAVEDNRFYSHHGFDMEGIMRATLVNLQYGQIEEGASTITQQLVKNLFLSHERSFGRKAEELLLAIDMELNYSKDEILELYLNTIYFGSDYYGISEASAGYFDKKPDELSLPEAAMLAGLPNAPSLYSPYVNFLMAKKRQFVVLDAMARTGYISDLIAENAKIKPVYLAH